jgi:nucleoside-diphosphate-sugar epimerase
MNVVITGANGFVGKALAARLLARGSAFSDIPLTSLTLVDIGFDAVPQDSRVRIIRGSIGEPGVLREACDQPADCVFHLASIPGGAAEANYELGLQINLKATLDMLELLRRQDTPARFVFSSSIAVYGAPLPAVVDDTTPMRPALSYGAHKLIDEILIKDYSRRGWLDGRILRLPGVVARPPAPSGLLSAYMSDIFWRLADGKPFVCPVSAGAVSWWMSVKCCVDNLLHAAALDPMQAAARRDFTLPVLRLTMAELIDGLVQEFGEDRRALVSYEPDAGLEAGFGRYPPLDASAADAAGFRHDGSVKALIRNAMLLPRAPDE